MRIKSLKVRTIVALSRFLLATLFIGSMTSPEAALAACRWDIVPSGNVFRENQMTGVSAVSSNNAWAVGITATGIENNSDTTMSEFWNGRRWHEVAIPNPGGSGTEDDLFGVSAISANDVWAVGDMVLNAGQTLIEHWNGTQWTVVPSPSPSGIDDALDGVAAVSTNDVWAVGRTQGNPSFQTLIEHWNGAQWTVVPSPNANNNTNWLKSVSVVSVNDVWAAGFYNVSDSVQLTLIEHWNGVRWKIIPSPNANNSFNNLSGIAAISQRDVWAVGRAITNGGLLGSTLTEHWDGASWAIIPSPNENASGLFSVAANSTDDVWAVGAHQGDKFRHTLTEHWAGGQWTIVPTPDEGTHLSNLLGVAAVGPNDILSVGDTGGETRSQTLGLLFHC